MSNLFKHIKIIIKHRHAVMRYCFKMCIPMHGLTHDLSKYSITELQISKYYTGAGSPHEECRRQLGYSKSWLHHKYHNKHHWQYWLDDSEDGKLTPIKMPYNYVIEMFCDMVGAGKAYLKDKWTVKSPQEYYDLHCKNKHIMDNQSEYLLEKLLWNLYKAESEKTFIVWYRQARTYLTKAYNQGNSDY